MECALAEAEISEKLGEVPIGAVIVKDGEIVGRGHNLTETTKDPTAHAEMIAIRDAAKHLGGWRLTGCEMYVTCEPCSMCAGAMVWSRIEKVHIGTMDPKAGAAGSVLNVLQEPKLNHRVSKTCVKKTNHRRIKQNEENRRDFEPNINNGNGVVRCGIRSGGLFFGKDLSC